jgi:hypothetical protein
MEQYIVKAEMSDMNAVNKDDKIVRGLIIPAGTVCIKEDKVPKSGNGNIYVSCTIDNTEYHRIVFMTELFDEETVEKYTPPPSGGRRTRRRRLFKRRTRRRAVKRKNKKTRR